MRSVTAFVCGTETGSVLTKKTVVTQSGLFSSTSFCMERHLSEPPNTTVRDERNQRNLLFMLAVLRVTKVFSLRLESACYEHTGNS